MLAAKSASTSALQGISAPAVQLKSTSNLAFIHSLIAIVLTVDKLQREAPFPQFFCSYEEAILRPLLINLR